MLEQTKTSIHKGIRKLNQTTKVVTVEREIYISIILINVIIY